MSLVPSAGIKGVYHPCPIQMFITKSKLHMSREGFSEFIVYICKHVQWSYVRRKPMEFAAPVSQLLLCWSLTWGGARGYYYQGRDLSNNSFQARWCLLSWASFKLHIRLGTQMELRNFFPQQGWGEEACCTPLSCYVKVFAPLLFLSVRLYPDKKKDRSHTSSPSGSNLHHKMNNFN